MKHIMDYPVTDEWSVDDVKHGFHHLINSWLDKAIEEIKHVSD